MDKLNLLTGHAGTFFNNECLQPDFNQMQCDIRLAEDNTPFIPDTKCILLLGSGAMHKYLPETRDNTLNEMRGSPFYINGIPALASYFPQDCIDFKNYEAQFNKQNSEDGSSYQDEEDEDEGGDVKRFSNTKRSNYAFFLKADIRKCKRVLSSRDNWKDKSNQSYVIYPDANEIINTLTNTKGAYLDFDMETDIEELNMLCFAFSLDNGATIYSVPILDYNYKPAYGPLTYHIIRALVVAIRNNTIVAHNGAAFDFLVLALKYHIPIYKCIDTLIVNRRIYPEIEASLGHCTSLWTLQKFHKDTDSFAYRTREHMMQKLTYCAKDVFTMSLIRQRQYEFAKTIPGLTESINLANRSIRPYITSIVQGVKYSQNEVDALVKENDELMSQYNRIIEKLIGPAGLAHCHAATKSKHKAFFPSSNVQCCDYFHDQLGYPVVQRSSTTQKPLLGKQQLYKLALEHKNPVITFSLLYRQVQKETSAVMFNPFKDDNGKLLPKNRGDE